MQLTAELAIFWNFWKKRYIIFIYYSLTDQSKKKKKKERESQKSRYKGGLAYHFKLEQLGQVE